MSNMKKAVIFAPFWQQVGHVGNYRVDRFVRWLAAAGYYIVLVRAGSAVGEREETWGVELTVRDPLGLYRDSEPAAAPARVRKPNKLRRMLVYLLFNPDPGVLWARAAAKHPTVLAHAQGVEFILASSPPDSAHIGAAILAKNLKTRLIVDMRDGWLDEPLKPLLRLSGLQRWREGRLEKRILKQAETIFVTSPVWKSLLNDRLPFTQDKSVVLTNGYPPSGLFARQQIKNRNRSPDEPLQLIHAGRFTGSRLSQKVSYLLGPLFSGLDGFATKGIITLLGRLETADMVEISKWQPQYEMKGWSIEVVDAVPREQMMELLAQADGLLLLSASQAAIPSKLFEYLTLKKPIFTATPKSSAVWQIGDSLEQMFLSNYEYPDPKMARSFLEACTIREHNYCVPDQFSEKVLSGIFLTQFSVERVVHEKN